MSHTTPTPHRRRTDDDAGAPAHRRYTNHRHGDALVETVSRTECAELSVTRWHGRATYTVRSRLGVAYRGPCAEAAHVAARTVDTILALGLDVSPCNATVTL